jgi:DNA recombination protein RmuC
MTLDIGPYAVPLDDPRLWAAAAAFVGFALLLRAVLRTARATEPLARHLAALDGAVKTLNDSQHQLYGGLKQVAQTQAETQGRLTLAMETRLAEVTQALSESLAQSSTRTARSLGDLQQRLETIDKAQSNIEKLSGNVLSLQDILSNKQTRGAFGEIQLRDIVTKALPPDAYAFQATLSNNRRADCLVHLPNPPGPIVIDAKFPLEAYEALRAAGTPQAQQEAARAFRTAVRAHLRAIAERYVIEGETAEGALMFLPSEAVYAELHANFGDVVREGFALRVWTVSPTTCMATLHTLRAILKDARMREQAHAIRRELGLLHKDVERLGARVGNLDRHFGQAARDIEEIKISADRAGNRARRLEAIDFAPPETEDAPAMPKADPTPIRLAPLPDRG